MIGLHRTLSFLALPACLSLAPMGQSHAQSSAATPPPASKVALPAAAEARALEARLPAPTLKPKVSFELSPQRQDRLQKLLPDTLRRLSQRERIHLLVLGDATSLGLWKEEAKTKTDDAFPAVFARDLAAQFFYTGGVRAADSSEFETSLSPSISIRTLTRPGGSVLDAAPILASTARQSPVNLVLLCYGQEDAGLSPVIFLRAVRQAIEAAHEIGAEVMLCAPWLPMAAEAEKVLGSSRPLADAMVEFAKEEGLVCADLGDLSGVLEMPATEIKDEGQRFERIAAAYRGFFHEGADGQFLPRAAFHERLGHLIFREFLDGPASQPWALTDSAAVWQKDGAALELRCTVSNASPERLDLTVLPLIAAGWKPVAVQPQVSLPAGARQTLAFQYARQSGDSGPVQESVVRLPVLILSSKRARIETLRASVQPISLIWELETLFNQEKRFTAGCQILSTSTEPQRGSWEAEFDGQSLQGKVDLAPGATQPLDLSFDLPAGLTVVKQATLKLLVKLDGLQLSSTRAITLSPNLGLNAAVPLTSEGAGQGSVSLRAQADAGRITLICDIAGAETLIDAPTAGAAAWQIDLNLDARSYGKRLEPGSTATLRATGRAVAGKGHVHDIPAWVFGNGYAAGFETREIHAALSSTSSDRHEISLSLPRSYLYLHEWALDNGNSQFGLNLRLTLNTAQGYRTWTLSPTTKPADAVEALSVLELTTAPTRRVTVDVH